MVNHVQSSICLDRKESLIPPLSCHLHSHLILKASKWSCHLHPCRMLNHLPNHHLDRKESHIPTLYCHLHSHLILKASKWSFHLHPCRILLFQLQPSLSLDRKEHRFPHLSCHHSIQQASQLVLRTWQCALPTFSLEKQNPPHFSCHLKSPSILHAILWTIQLCYLHLHSSPRQVLSTLQLDMVESWINPLSQGPLSHLILSDSPWDRAWAIHLFMEQVCLDMGEHPIHHLRQDMHHHPILLVSWRTLHQCSSNLAQVKLKEESPRFLNLLVLCSRQQLFLEYHL